MNDEIYDYMDNHHYHDEREDYEDITEEQQMERHDAMKRARDCR